LAEDGTYPQESASLTRCRVQVTGLVQGVGFRPHVYRLASELGLSGWVLNSSSGVTIEVEGPKTQVAEFVARLRRRPPPLARIASLEEAALPPTGERRFVILASQDEGARKTLVSPDIAVCEACRREMGDPADRRFGYPFINCTDCGPRYTIVENLPYDRPLTSMKAFEMCPRCRAEYEDPADRRFHAQPNACPVCGPEVWLEDAGGRVLARAPRPGGADPSASSAADFWRTVRGLLRRGAIVAVKGLGGFHLACDARSEAAVRRLRARKDRPAKPLAVMAPDLDAARRYVTIGDRTARLLLSPAAPILVLPARDVNPALAPGAVTLGLMLAYTPLHLLLFGDGLDLLVMTSANRRGLPIVRDNDAARRELAGLVDYFLFHDRDIVNRCEDSVIRVVERDESAPGAAGLDRTGGSSPEVASGNVAPSADCGPAPAPVVIFYRRSRGYAPEPLDVSASLPPERRQAGREEAVLGAGAEMKSTFCLLRGGEAFLSPHLGEMDYVESLAVYRETYDRYLGLLDVTPHVAAFDPHPGYNSSRLARRLASGRMESLPVYHHHAHLVSCLADNGLPGNDDVLGLVCDGTGYGSDGAIWGFELLAGSALGFRRLGHLAYTWMPGGDAAARYPYRAAAAHFHRALGRPGVERLASLYPERCAELEALLARLEHPRSGRGRSGEDGPRKSGALTSSCGRLFDAVAALAGLTGENTYEGQAAVELTELLGPGGERGQITEAAYRKPPPGYRFEVALNDDGLIVIDPAPFLRAALDELETLWAMGREVDTVSLSLTFHRALTEAAVRALVAAREQTGLETVCLSGGTFQNPFLVTWLCEQLEDSGFQVFIHRRVPPNDGGLSLGQAVAAAWQTRLKRR